MSECVGFRTQEKIQTVEPLFGVLGNKIILKMIATSGDTFKNPALGMRILSIHHFLFTHSNHHSPEPSVKVGMCDRSYGSSLRSDGRHHKAAAGSGRAQEG